MNHKIKEVGKLLAGSAIFISLLTTSYPYFSAIPEDNGNCVKEVFSGKESSTLNGIILNDDGKPMPHALVSVNDLILKLDEQGRFSQEVLNKSFQVDAVYLTYKHFRKENIKVNFGDSIVLTVIMEKDTTPLMEKK